jgi:hypothetical protein
MMTYTWDDLPVFVAKASRYVAYRYRRFVEYDDVAQEINLWLYSKGRANVERWLDPEHPQQTTRIYRSMLDVGIKYAEAEKAETSGYKPDDVWWYTPQGVEGLLPLALNRSFRQQNEHVGDLITMVIDIRKALDAAHLFDWFTDNDESHEDWAVNLQLVVDQLGGERPAVGRRKVLSNAQAQSVTAGAYE